MNVHHTLNLSVVDPSWRDCVEEALSKMNSAYLTQLSRDKNWLPGPEKIFNAFSLPVQHTKYILLGESPYPRPESANGYAFWDDAVTTLWSPTGLDKKVNRATSLRNIIKMLLMAENRLTEKDTSQDAIAKINKNNWVQTNTELFSNFLRHGFLLLNATLALPSSPVKKEALAWQPFIEPILHFLFRHSPSAQFILFGKIAELLNPLIQDWPVKKLIAEHPYNISFIQNPDVIHFFKPLHLLWRDGILLPH